MSKIYFIAGFVGSGKTTYAKKLAQAEKGFRFSLDEWMIPLFGEHMEREVFDSRLATLQELFKEAALELTSLGVPVIFDFGFWTRKDREAFMAWATHHNLIAEMHYLDVSFELCKQRASLRNADLQGKSYEMTPEMLDLFWSWFEVPTADEKVIRVGKATDLTKTASAERE